MNRYTRKLLVALVLALSVSVVAAPAADAQGGKGHKHDCPRLDERIAKIEAKQAKEIKRHSQHVAREQAGTDQPQSAERLARREAKVQRRLADLADEITAAKAACT